MLNRSPGGQPEILSNAVNLPDHPEPPPDRLIRLAAVCDIVGVSRATIYRMIRAETFPPPVKVNAASLWVEREVSAWVDVKVEKRE